MTVTSFSFLVLTGAGVIIYYMIPKKYQWIGLLALSLVFYYKAGTAYTIVYLMISTAIAYASTMLMDDYSRNCRKQSHMPFVIAIAAVVLNIGIWFVVKGRGLWAFFLGRLSAHFYIPYADALLNLQLAAALGMGYYTLQIVGYIVDCYWGNVTPQRNPCKLFLFTAYFPQLTTGPISRYHQLESLYEGHRFDYHNLAFGAQRILWGFVKKIVLAERVGMIVTAITLSDGTYAGFYSWIAILLYPIQMYADFSGCMDIVLGVSEMFGIQLAENFNNPFFSRSSQEFWQRWHITLGSWAKDYVLYPLLKTDLMVNFGKLTRKKFNRKISKFLVNLAGMLVLWMVMGIWHGGMRYIAGVSMWYWLVLMLGELLSPLFQKVLTKLKIKTESFSWHLFQSARTYVIYAAGAMFFCVGVIKGIDILIDAWKVVFVRGYANPWIFFDGSILNLGVSYGDINIIILTVLLMILAAVLREKYGHARIWIASQCVVFRWAVWLALFVFVLIWGKYGPGYDAAEFIYRGF